MLHHPGASPVTDVIARGRIGSEAAVDSVGKHASEQPERPSRPGEFHPEPPLTDPDVILSHRPRGWSRLCLFPWHRRPGSHVPYKSTTGIADPQRMKRC